jgi:hypothetical protein
VSLTAKGYDPPSKRNEILQFIPRATIGHVDLAAEVQSPRKTQGGIVLNLDLCVVRLVGSALDQLEHLWHGGPGLQGDVIEPWTWRERLSSHI